MRDGWARGLVAVLGGGGRAKAGETRDCAKRGHPVSRAAGASGAWKTRGAKSNMRHHAGPPPTDASSLNMRGTVMEPPPRVGRAAPLVDASVGPASASEPRPRQSDVGRSRDSTADSREEVVSTSSSESVFSSILRGRTPVDVASSSGDATGTRFLIERRLMIRVPVDVVESSTTSSVSSASSLSSVSSVWAAWHSWAF